MEYAPKFLVNGFCFPKLRNYTSQGSAFFFFTCAAAVLVYIVNMAVKWVVKSIDQMIETLALVKILKSGFSFMNLKFRKTIEPEFCPHRARYS